jgi:hypothetical protein
MADSPPKPPITRRRLLQGTLGAPLVMTVTPVLGVARTTFMACLNKSEGQPEGATAPLEGALPDEWLRVDLDIVEVTVLNERGAAVPQPGRYFVGPDRVAMYRLDDVRPEAAPATLVNGFNAHTYGMQTRTVERRRALAHVDEHGNLVGYAWQPRGGSRITASCYASIIARGFGEGRRL